MEAGVGLFGPSQNGFAAARGSTQGRGIGEGEDRVGPAGGAGQGRVGQGRAGKGGVGQGQVQAAMLWQLFRAPAVHACRNTLKGTRTAYTNNNVLCPFTLQRCIQWHRRAVQSQSHSMHKGQLGGCRGTHDPG